VAAIIKSAIAANRLIIDMVVFIEFQI